MATAVANTNRVLNPCCCGCSLTNAVSSIAVLEALFNVIGACITISRWATAVNGDKSLRKNSVVTEDEEFWGRYYQNHGTTLMLTLGLFCIALVATSFLCVAISRRVLASCYGWMVCAVGTAIGHLVVLALDQYPLTITIAVLLLLRFYFIIVVYFFSMEVRQFPNGEPVVFRDVREYPVIVEDGASVMATRPVTYAYPPAIGYGRPYGYHDDGLGVGLALGLGLGGGLGYGYGGGGLGYGYGGGFYDDCYYDDCYF